ncbi:MAG: cbb3-type cytochrome c oxidase subunit 3 [Cellvibrio sp.]|jgi:cytochrome c oxidase cbb3-type subunit 4|nr:cbb3-type cytochrome c oxidase subunit 3 [Cellvibrio sp.]
MDQGTVGAISTVLVTIAFFGVCVWAFSPGLKKRFEEDAKLPFADEPEFQQNDDQKKNHPEGRI